MADFKDIVTEIETIATAQSGISSFKYGNPFEINESRANTKPMLMLHKQRSITFNNFEKKFKDYEIIIGIYDTYKQSEQSTKSYQEKQEDLENLTEQFLREFRKRSLGSTSQITSTQDWFMLSGDGSDIVRIELIENVGADKYVGIEATLTIRVYSDCDEGTFSY